ncbi:MAG: class I SAM-dependent methyltransferase [Bacteroidota bacterium]
MDLQKNADRFTGFGELYDRYRPRPPKAIFEQVLRHLGGQRPQGVLDMGCGTGLSTLGWLDYCEHVVGIEPSEEMLAVARRKLASQPEGLAFVQGFGHELPVSDGTVEVVSCSQAFHWMEPKATLAEVARALRPGGVFLTIDCGWPPSCHYRAERAYEQLFEQVFAQSRSLEEPMAHRFPKAEHLANIEASGHFEFVKMAYYHQMEAGSRERLEGLALSQGELQSLRRRGFSDTALGLTPFREQLSAITEEQLTAMTFHYTVIFAVKKQR